jgi:predicted transcriptional regulator
MRGLGDLEAVIMQRMWDRTEPATVRDLVEELRQSRDIAYTTVMTVMDNLHRKGWLHRTQQGRAYEYSTIAGRAEYVAMVMRDALDDSGDPALALQHFVGTITAAEAIALRQALDDLGGAQP